MDILIVDDQPAIVSILMERLSSRDHRVWGLTKGSEVEAWITNHAVDVIILDIQLKDADGMAMISRLAATSVLKIIAMSGTCDELTRRTALDHGAMEFLPKPIPFDVLLDLLNKAS